jgi:hypothetical protein
VIRSYEAKEHLPHLLENPSTESPSEVTLWLLATTFVIREAFIQLEIFADMRQQAEELQALQIRHASAISPDKDLPDEYVDAILSFWLCIKSSAGGRLQNLQIGVTASPPLHRLFVNAVPLQLRDILPWSSYYAQRLKHRELERKIALSGYSAFWRAMLMIRGRRRLEWTSCSDLLRQTPR